LPATNFEKDTLFGKDAWKKETQISMSRRIWGDSRSHPGIGLALSVFSFLYRVVSKPKHLAVVRESNWRL
jgi:hypothetical protein